MDICMNEGAARCHFIGLVTKSQAPLVVTIKSSAFNGKSVGGMRERVIVATLYRNGRKT